MSDSEPNAVKNFFAGTAAGVTQVFVGQPFDTVKVRLQSQPSGPGQVPIYSGAGDCVKKIIKNEGLKAFYKGTVPPLMGIGLCVSIQFAVVEQTKGYYNKVNKGGPLDNTQLFLSGAAAGVANSIVSGPVEHIRSRLQVQTGAAVAGGSHFTGPLDCVKKVYAAEGLPGVYKGQFITVVREFFGYGFYFLGYEWAISKLKEKTGKPITELHPGLVMMCGAFGGFSMWIPVYPVDVVKSKLQTDALGAARKFNGTLDCIRKTFAAEGVAGFYKGFTPCLLRAAPVNASTFLAFELAMRLMGRD